MCKCVFFCSKGRPETRSNGGAKNLNEINAVKKSAIFLCACIYPYCGEFRGKKTTTQLRLFKAAQLCFLNYQHCGVLALKENGKQRSFMQVFEGYTLKALNVPMQTSYSFCFTY